MTKENYLSDWAVQSDQVGAIKAGLKGVNWEQGTTHVTVDTVGFIRLARDNDMSFVSLCHYPDGRPYLLSATGGPIGYIIHSELE